MAISFLSFENEANDSRRTTTRMNRHATVTNGNMAAIKDKVESGIESERSPENTADGFMKNGFEIHSHTATQHTTINSAVPTIGQFPANLPRFPTNVFSRGLRFTIA